MYICNYFKKLKHWTISKIIIDIISDNKAKETITNFINLNNVSFNNAEFLNPILAEYDGVNFEAIYKQIEGAGARNKYLTGNFGKFKRKYKLEHPRTTKKAN